jgi:hypothetical protein
MTKRIGYDVVLLGGKFLDLRNGVQAQTQGQDDQK